MPDDLFGQPIPEPVLLTRAGTPRKNKPAVANGYAFRPGSGPAGETCKSCAHACYVSHAKRYWKCGLVRHAWKGSLRTDIRLRSPACFGWEAKK